MATRSLLLNPFKEIGILHNKGLNYVVTHLDSSIPVTQEVIVDLTCTYISQIGSRATDVDFAWYKEITSKSLNRLRQYPLEASLWKADVSRQGIEYISEINDLSDDYRAAISAVERIQSTILDSKILDSDKEYPLLYAAVTLASLEYWVAQMSDPASPWIPFGGGTTARWPWREDGKGAVEGAVAGATAAALDGGNVLHGALVGAVAGGVAASVTAFFFRD